MFTGASALQASSSDLWLPSHSSSTSMSSSAATAQSAFPTISDAQVLPFSRDPGGDSRIADTVVVDLHADVTISHYHRYYGAPLESFRPTYYALDDGSLLTEAYVGNLDVSKAWVFVAGALCVFYLRNTLMAASYLRRSKVKDKTLFHLLLASQAFGLLGAMALAIGDLNQSVDCTAVGAAKKVFMKLSCDTMITGILGLKAYRCLGNGRIVLVFLMAVVVAMVVLLVLEIIHYEGHRTIYGGCADSHYMRYVSSMIMIAFAETAVICACFLYAIWKSHRTQAEARLTIRLSEEGQGASMSRDVKGSAEGAHQSRGWWDYVPDAHTQSSPPSGAERYSFADITHTIRCKLRGLWSRENIPSSIAFRRKSSLPGEHPIPHPARSVFRTGSNTRFSWMSRRDAHDSMVHSEPPCSLIRKWINGFSGVELFRKMLRNELLYTTLLTVIFLALAVVMLVGVSKKVWLGAEGWILVDWIIVTCFTMHSFRRVVRRHEIEAVLQHPSAWERILRAEMDYAQVFEKRSRRSKSPKQDVDSQLRPRHSRNPQEDSTSIQTSSEISYQMSTPPFTVTPHLNAHSFRKLSASSSLPSIHFTESSSPLYTTHKPFMWDSAVIFPSALPSPVTGDYPLEPDADAVTPRPATAPADLPIHYDSVRYPPFDLRTHLRTSMETGDTRDQFKTQPS